MEPVTLRTQRLLLRPWRDEDLLPFAELNADPEVMRHFPSTLTHRESATSVERIRAGFATRGWGLWAVELPGEAPFVGFVGLHVPLWEAHFTPCVEIGWRLARRWQGRGIATEGARASLAFAFETLRLPEVVALTTPDNLPSRHVMEKLGMQRNPADDFDHPVIPEGHPLRRHVLYRIS